MATNREGVIRWLLGQGFRELPRGADGHRRFELRGVKMSIVAHGTRDMSPKVIALMARQLAQLGLDPREVKGALLGRRRGGRP